MQEKTITIESIEIKVVDGEVQYPEYEDIHSFYEGNEFMTALHRLLLRLDHHWRSDVSELEFMNEVFYQCALYINSSEKSQEWHWEWPCSQKKFDRPGFGIYLTLYCILLHAQDMPEHILDLMPRMRGFFDLQAHNFCKDWTEWRDFIEDWMEKEAEESEQETEINKLKVENYDLIKKVQESENVIASLQALLTAALNKGGLYAENPEMNEAETKLGFIIQDEKIRREYIIKAGGCRNNSEFARHVVLEMVKENIITLEQAKTKDVLDKLVPFMNYTSGNNVEALRKAVDAQIKVRR